MISIPLLSLLTIRKKKGITQTPVPYTAKYNNANTPLKIKQLGYTFSKNESRHDSQDSFHCAQNTFVLCDGVSQSFLPAIFSRILSAQSMPFLLGGKSMNEVLEDTKKEYHQAVKTQLQSWVAQYKKGIPSHMVSRLKNGQLGASTMLMGKLAINKPILHTHYRGDCNLFVLDKHHNLVFSYPFVTKTELDNSPEVIKGNGLSEEIYSSSIPLPTVGVILVCTDALARYILIHKPPERNILLQSLLDIKDQASFEKFIVKTWESKQHKFFLEKDDVSLIVIEYSYD